MRDAPFAKWKQTLALVGLNLLLLVFSPFILLKKLSRVLRHRASHELDLRRFVVANVGPDVPMAPLPGPNIVLVGPSFGEMRLMAAVTRLIKASRPNVNVIWCMREMASIDLAKTLYPEQPIAIWPFENLFSVSRWCSLLKPDVVVITEKFWLPNLIAINHLRGAKVAVMNARSHGMNRGGDGLKAPYYRWMARDLDLICFQAPQFLEDLKHLMRPSTLVSITGNMKLDLEVAPLEESRAAEVESWLSTRGSQPLLVAGSTAVDADEDFVFSAFAKVRESVDCCLMIAPRKTFRATATAEAARARGYRASVRTLPSDAASDVYVLDTMGELSHAYQFGVAAFIGGTLESTGHNVVEPVSWGKPVAYGPLRGHFEELQKLCESFGVGFRCFTSDDLADFWTRAITDAAFREEMERKSLEMLVAERGATQKTADAILAITPR